VPTPLGVVMATAVATLWSSAAAAGTGAREAGT
jgi:hypothetical protein